MGIFYRRLPRFDYIVPKSLDEALRALNKYKGASKLSPDLGHGEKKKAPLYLLRAFNASSSDFGTM